MITQQSIRELAEFFGSRTIDKTHIKLNNSDTIIDVKRFLNSHFATINANIGNEYFVSYQDRLYQLKQIIENEKT